MAEKPLGVSTNKIPLPGSPGTRVILRVRESTNFTDEPDRSIGSVAFWGVHRALVPTRKPEPITFRIDAPLPDLIIFWGSAPGGVAGGLPAASVTSAIAGGSTVKGISANCASLLVILNI